MLNRVGLLVASPMNPGEIVPTALEHVEGARFALRLLRRVCMRARRKHVITRQGYIAQLVRCLEDDGVLPLPIFINGIEAHTVVRAHGEPACLPCPKASPKPLHCCLHSCPPLHGCQRCNDGHGRRRHEGSDALSTALPCRPRSSGHLQLGAQAALALPCAITLSGPKCSELGEGTRVHGLKT